jgi:hypothetical protein
MGEGDLFGVRALEKGFYGGVAQVTPLPSAANSPALSPARTNRGSNDMNTTSSSSSFQDLDLSQSTSASESSNPKKNASLTLSRLQPSDAELNGRRNHDPAVNMANFMPPSPSTSNHPEIPKIMVGSHVTRSTELASSGASSSHAVITSVASNGPNAKSPMISIFPPSTLASLNLPAGARRPGMPNRSVSDDSHSRNMSYDGRTSPTGTAPTVELRTMSSFSNWGDNVINDAARPVSPHLRADKPSAQHLSRTHSAEALSMESERAPRNRTRSRDALREAAHHNAHARNQSSSSARSISRTQDSVKRPSHTRQPSQEATNERNRDQLHYDPRAGARNRSGSVQGRNVDFDSRRESPFDDVHRMKHAKKDSDSSTYSTDTSSSTNSSRPQMTEADDERENERKLVEWRARDKGAAQGAPRDTNLQVSKNRAQPPKELSLQLGGAKSRDTTTHALDLALGLAATNNPSLAGSPVGPLPSIPKAKPAVRQPTRARSASEVENEGSTDLFVDSYYGRDSVFMPNSNAAEAQAMQKRKQGVIAAAAAAAAVAVVPRGSPMGRQI